MCCVHCFSILTSQLGYIYYYIIITVNTTPGKWCDNSRYRLSVIGFRLLSVDKEFASDCVLGIVDTKPAMLK